MQVKTLIQPSAAIVQVTEVAVSNIYKRLEKPSYGEEQILFGVVTDVLNNGEDSAIVALEFVPTGYGTGMNARMRTFRGDGEVALFPATTEEFTAHLADAIVVQQRAVESARADLTAKESVLERMTSAQTFALTTPKAVSR